MAEFIKKILKAFVIKTVPLINIKGKKLLFFIGSARTGSTLLGQILNYHPECLISNEARFITSVVIHGLSFEEALKDVVINAHKQFKTGLENDKKFGKTIARFQPKWVPMGDLSKDPDFKKKEIKVIGDKKAGGNIQAFIEKPNEMLKFLDEQQNVFLLQIIRNPVDAAFSLMRSHGVKQFEKACEEIIMRTHTAYILGNQTSNPYFYVYYEDLIENPEIEIIKILSWLNIKRSNSWLFKISKIVNQSKPKNHPKKYYRIAQNMIKKYDASNEFNKYQIKSLTGKNILG